MLRARFYFKGGSTMWLRSTLHPQRHGSWRSYLAAALIVALCSLLGGISHTYRLTEANVVMIFLAGVALVAARFGRGPAIAAAILSVLVFDFFFVFPSFSFVVTDAQYFITLAVMLGIGLLISALTFKLQQQLTRSQARELRTLQLYELTRHLSELSGTDAMLHSACQHIERIFDSDVFVYLQQPDGSLSLQVGQETEDVRISRNRAAARWAVTRNCAAGANTNDIQEATALFVPMIGSQRTVGALGVKSRDPQRFSDSEQQHTLEICGGLIAFSIERDQLAQVAHQAQLAIQETQLQMQAEQTRNSMLTAVSHDLRTPLATIAVTVSSLLDDSIEQDSAGKREMLQTVLDESHRLGRQIENLLGHARLTAGTIVLSREWEALEELVEAALVRLRMHLAGHTVCLQIGDEIPPVWVAGDLMEHLFVNLLDNAIRYTPRGTTIEISAARRGGHIDVTVADDGPGLPPGSENRVFEKFFRGTTIVADGHRGIGLGLAICKVIAEAHGGQIAASNRAQGGARFVLSLPCHPTALDGSQQHHAALQKSDP